MSEKPGRFDPAFRADLIEFARDRIQSVWDDVPEGVTAQVLAENIVHAQEFLWLSLQNPLPAHDEQVRADTLRESREQAWRDGYYTGKRDYAGSIMGGMPMSTPN
ncbi:MAG TPA: hypothetical protein VN039_01170, partial [Nitrospira sp.]|nr:hypothetical protein [Nitrospira sp.]